MSGEQLEAPHLQRGSIISKNVLDQFHPVVSAEAQVFRTVDVQWTQMTSRTVLVHILRNKKDGTLCMTACDDSKLCLDFIPISTPFSILVPSSKFLHLSLEHECYDLGFGFMEISELEVMRCALEKLDEPICDSRADDYIPNVAAGDFGQAFHNAAQLPFLAQDFLPDPPGSFDIPVRSSTPVDMGSFNLPPPYHNVIPSPTTVRPLSFTDMHFPPPTTFPCNDLIGVSNVLASLNLNSNTLDGDSIDDAFQRKPAGAIGTPLKSGHPTSTSSSGTENST